MISKEDSAVFSPLSKVYAVRFKTWTQLHLPKLALPTGIETLIYIGDVKCVKGKEFQGEYYNCLKSLEKIEANLE